MHPKVEEFLQKAKEEELKNRQKKLIELGLYEKVECDGTNGFHACNRVWNQERQCYELKHYTHVAIDVSDEEYEEILNANANANANANNTRRSDGAESILGILNVITLILGIAAGFICLIIGVNNYGSGSLIISGICITIISIISWAALKVILNISNNLHQINSKLK